MADREKLIELLARYFDIGDSYAYNLTRDKNAFVCGTMGFDDFEEFDDETVADIADHLIANGVTIQRWIPVTERLPEDDENIHFYDDGRLRCVTVLAYTEYGRTIPKNRLLVRPTGIEYLDTQVTDGWVWASGTEEVTHWMPIPEAPKGE